MNNKQEQEMMSKVANCEEGGILIVHRAHASNQSVNDETEANLLNCFRELTIGQVGCDNAHAAITVYSNKVEEVDTFRACRKINRGMPSPSASPSASNRDIS